ncbi:MAG: Y-family DNA polymerase [Pseudomonadota bacterium]|nr:Y-family DNA polymerase [Pseudomonadota bacterium]
MLSTRSSSRKFFALVDCNNFFVSCERVFNPFLDDKPIIVLSNNDGCIIARSNEVKTMGIPMGAPFHHYRHTLLEKGIHIYSSNYQLYGDMSGRVMDSLRLFSPDVEVYSIDEAFVRFKYSSKRDYIQYLNNIRNSVFKWTGIPVSIGLGPTKTLAKIANSLAKKSKVDSVFDLTPLSIQIEILEHVQVEDIWGISKRWGAKLRLIGIGNALQLRNASPQKIRQYLGVTLERIVYELRGVSCLDLEQIKSRKNIMISRSFGNSVDNLSDLGQAVSLYTIKACEKMRLQNSRAQAVYIFLRTNRFSSNQQQYNAGIVFGFNNPCSDTGDIITKVKEGLTSIFKHGYLYQQAGVMLMDLVSNDVYQEDLFESFDYTKSDSRMSILDSINGRFGPGTLFYVAAGLKKDGDWQSRTHHLSPRYTTKWNELPYVS